MFEVGFTEIVLILGLALLVLGPEKLPDLARKVGRWTGRARSMARQLRTQLEQEVTLEELSRSRPMDPGPPPPDAPESAPAPADSAPYTDPIAPVEPSPEPPHRGPGLDLDRHVSGLETEPADSPETVKDPK